MADVHDLGSGLSRGRTWLAAVGLLALPSGVVASAQAGTTERVSVTSDGTQATPGPSGSLWVAISADGRFVAFESPARNLAGDPNSLRDVFVHDRQTGATGKVSVSSSGMPGNGASGELGLAISAKGRFIAFESDAGNLVSDDTNATHDVFVRDRQTGTTERVSVGANGEQSNDRSQWPKMSANGRFVTFWSLARNLVSGDTNGFADVFVRDRQTGTTERVSVGANGKQADADSFPAGISASGRFVIFNSGASNLVSHATGGSFIRDRKLGTTKRISAAGATGIAANGRFVVLDTSSALVPDDTNGHEDVYVYDRRTGTVGLVSLGPGGSQGDGDSSGAAISPDGRFVAFVSEATNLVSGDTNGSADVFVRDRQAGVTERVSLTADGRQAKGQSFNPALSATGRLVTFSSQAPNLVPGDTNHNVDVFVRVR